MTGVAAATVGVGLATTAASMYSAGKNREQAQQGIDAASRNAEQANALQREMADRQLKLATAGQVDARGNRVIYDPQSNTWKSLLSPEGQALVARSDAINKMHDVETLGRGQQERSAAFQRRVAEGSTAAPLLDAIKYGYGAPSREGVAGANKIAAATGGAEAGDVARGGYNAAALRTGTGAVPLEHTLASIDRGTTGGIRSALANVDADRSLYGTSLDNFRTGKANLYNALATRASNVENIPFAPSTIPETMDAASLNRSIRAPTATYNPNAGAVQTAASKNLLDAIGKYPQDETGRVVGTGLNSILDYFKKQQEDEKKKTLAGAGGGFTGTAHAVGQDPSERVVF